MNLKHTDLSLFAGELELVTIPGEYLDTLKFPYTYEDIETVSILFGDSWITDNIVIEAKLLNSKLPCDFSLNGNNISYTRLFEFIDENSDEPITRAYFTNFQLTLSVMFQEDFTGFSRKTPKKPIVRQYLDGSLLMLEFMPIDNHFTYTDYSGFSQWNKPHALYFDENQKIKDSISSIRFAGYQRDKKTEDFKLDDYKVLLNKLIGHDIRWNHATYELEFDNYIPTALDKYIIDVYFFFNDYKRKQNIMFKNRD